MSFPILESQYAEHILNFFGTGSPLNSAVLAVSEVKLESEVEEVQGHEEGFPVLERGEGEEVLGCLILRRTLARVLLSFWGGRGKRVFGLVWYSVGAEPISRLVVPLRSRKGGIFCVPSSSHIN